jgi:toluene monooxygenase system ferredoxin subunit
MFTKACEENELREGKYEVAAVNRVLVLIVWPKDGQPRAFQGMCPHSNEPLADARFNGAVLTCAHHDWEFDGISGACIKGKACTLAEYPLKIENGEVLIDTADVTPSRVG